MNRSWRHPLSGDHRWPKPPSHRATRRAQRSPKVRQPRMRPRKSLNPATLVASPEEQSSRPNLRLNIIAVIVLLLFGVMVLRLWTLQIIDHRNYAAAVNANGIRVVSLPAPRGQIVDRDNTLLVGDQVQQEIVLSRSAAAEHPEVIGAVAALVGQPESYVQSQLKSVQYGPYQPVPVMLDAPMATVQFLQAHESQFPGVSVEQITQRIYPQGGDLAPHVLGYVGDINGAELKAHPNQGYLPTSQIGKTGVEAQYEQYLRGVAGRQSLEVSSKGDVVGTLSRTNPIQGDTLVLNIDAGLQQALQTSLANTIVADRQVPDPRSNVKPPAPNGAAIVLNPQNGQVLAMASYPSFDLNQWVGGISQAELNAILATSGENNYAIQGLYTPGSTFKLITATAALQNAVITPDEVVNDTGVFTIPGCTGAGAGCSFKDDEASDAGDVTMSSALTKSDDYYFYRLGYLFNVKYPNGTPQPIQATAAQYGEGVSTGIDLPGEAVGRVDGLATRQKLHAENPKAFPNETWYTGDNVELAFGQGGTVLTPIEQAVAYATFANGGTRYAPEVASGVVDPMTGKVLHTIAPKVTGKVDLPPSIYQPILQGLEGVISDPSGTAYGVFQGFPLDTFPLAGKTGTASNAQGLEPNSWFVAFGPEPNPQYLVLAVIDQGGYGATVAAPVVRDAFDYIYANPIPNLVYPSPTNPPSPTQPPVNPPISAAPTTTTTATPGATP